MPEHFSTPASRAPGPYWVRCRLGHQDWEIMLWSEGSRHWTAFGSSIQFPDAAMLEIDERPIERVPSDGVALAG